MSVQPFLGREDAAALPAPSARCAVSATGSFRSGRALTDLRAEDAARVCACCRSCRRVSEQVDGLQRSFLGQRGPTWL